MVGKNGVAETAERGSSDACVDGVGGKSSGRGFKRASSAANHDTLWYKLASAARLRVDTTRSSLDTVVCPKKPSSRLVS